VFSRLSALRVEFVNAKKNSVNAVVFHKPGGSSLTKMRRITLPNLTMRGGPVKRQTCVSRYLV